ncbi:rhodanese-like domain-containing protein [bacterium]|nr:rhodanese-like domain-containing protein [bacterium]
MNEQIEELDPEKYVKNSETVLIDVRRDEEWEEGFLEGAVHIPLDTLEEAPIPEKEQYVLYCAAGKRSLKGAEILQERGFSNVKSLAGGIQAAQHSIPVRTSRKEGEE